MRKKEVMCKKINRKMKTDNIIDGLFNPDIDKAQTDYLRKTVLEYVKSISGDGLNELSILIHDIAGEQVSRETLRRFVKDKNSRRNKKGNSTKANNKKLIAYTLAHEDIDWLDLNELEISKNLDSQVPERLAKYLNITNKDLLHSYSGEYLETTCSSRHDKSDRYINISIIENQAHFHVKETVKQVELIHSVRCSKFGEKSLEKIEYGWGVFHQKDMLMIIIRRLQARTSSCYLSLTNPCFDEQNKITQFIITSQDEPCRIDWSGIEENDSVLNKLKSSINIVILQRSDDFPCGNMRKEDIVNDEDTNDNKVVTLGRRKLTKSTFLEKKRFSRQGALPKIDSQGEYKKGNLMDEKMGEQLIDAACNMDNKIVKRLVKQDPGIVNYEVESTGVRAYQISAKCGDWDSFEAMIETGKCDLLHRDKRGYLTSQFAAEDHGNMKACSAIMDMEKEQGKKVGIVPLASGDMTTEEFVEKYGHEYGLPAPE